MSNFVLSRPASAVGWELRGALASRRVVRLVLSERCNGVLPNEQGQRVLEGCVDGVSPTDGYCVIRGRHVPIDDVLSVLRPHFSQPTASDPADPMDRRGDYTDAPLGRIGGEAAA